MSDYRWDLFISYKRGHCTELWVRTVLYPTLCNHAPPAGIRRTSIFWDDESLPYGSQIDQIKEAATTARCVLAVLSPDYFYESEWCWREWRTFANREAAAGLLNQAHQGTGIIYPLVHVDDHEVYPFHEEARQRRLDRSFLEYATLYGQQRGSERWSAFEARAVTLCKGLAQRAYRAPHFDPTLGFDDSAPPPRPRPEPLPLPSKVDP